MYEIVISNCDTRVGRALFLMMNDNDGGNDADEDNRGEGRTTVKGDVNNIRNGDSAVVDSLLVTPRPSVGKKKATRLMEFAECRHGALLPGHNTTTSQQFIMLLLQSRVQYCFVTHDSLIRLAAAAAEAKNLLAQNQLMLQLFMHSRTVAGP
jgi:hypothetical protein